MAVSTKTIKRRIKSISNTKKITKAMEMISAVKMRRAVGNVLNTRSYANLSWEMLQDIAKKVDIRLHPLLHQRSVKKVGMIYITSNRGLAGGFSSRLLQEAHKFVVEQESKNTQVEIILSGKKGKKMYQRFGHSIAAEYDKLDLTTKIEEVLPIVQLAIADYITGKYDKVVVAYTDFVSAVQQVSKVKQILPLSEAVLATPPSVSPLVGGRSWDNGVRTIPSPYPARGGTPLGGGGKGEDGGGGLEALENEVELTEDVEESRFLFEPTPREVLDVLLPRLVEMQVYQAILESDASEHSSRMVAMKSASDAAGDMIKELNQSFNKARQAGITREISEIVGGAAALE